MENVKVTMKSYKINLKKWLVLLVKNRTKLRSWRILSRKKKTSSKKNRTTLAFQMEIWDGKILHATKVQEVVTTVECNSKMDTIIEKNNDKKDTLLSHCVSSLKWFLLYVKFLKYSNSWLIYQAKENAEVKINNLYI